ncbi:MAG: class I SAM-dependent methyltransferase [Magnetococcales bacterium]|nr:class I SAM-dependent methyltransferase [Magnetococcales bacterium]MBF0150341.1 class I SAM-dependent methyltransferase [Magnetococcales bacterium]MBF0629458.1 class I SAM-dependent methyltransferase [Magnetococcales bacterium]
MVPDTQTRDKWDRAATFFDLSAAWGTEKRWAPSKKALFARMEGEILFMAAGTGLDFPCFPRGKTITAIDISPKMLERAAVRAKKYNGHLELQEMDATAMTFGDGRFDQVFTSCTFCSVPDPVAGLKEIRRVLKPGGFLFMFEHTGSRIFPFNLMLHLMTPISRTFGPEMNRDTLNNLDRAGFAIHRVENHFLDVVRSIHAQNPNHPTQ